MARNNRLALILLALPALYIILEDLGWAKASNTGE